MALSLLIVAGLGGVFLHWYNRYLQGRETCSLKKYLFDHNRSASLKMALSVIGTEVSFYLTLDPNISVWTNDFFRVLLEQGAAAYVADSIMNRGGPQPEVQAVITQAQTFLNDAKKNPDATDYDKILEQDSKL